MLHTPIMMSLLLLSATWKVTYCFYFENGLSKKTIRLSFPPFAFRPSSLSSMSMLNSEHCTLCACRELETLWLVFFGTRLIELGQLGQCLRLFSELTSCSFELGLQFTRGLTEPLNDSLGLVADPQLTILVFDELTVLLELLQDVVGVLRHILGHLGQKRRQLRANRRLCQWQSTCKRTFRLRDRYTSSTAHSSSLNTALSSTTCSLRLASSFFLVF